MYSRTINGETTYNYTMPHAGSPHSVSIGRVTPQGTQLVAYAHTHPNSVVFSDPDKSVAVSLGIDAYVVGPDLNLQRYDYTTGEISSVGFITPLVLTDQQKADLIGSFQSSWDAHVAEGCKFNCRDKLWPTP